METVIRIALIYIVIVIGLRVLGKREFSQMSPLELVSLLLIPEIASQALTREDFSFTNAVVGLATLFVLVFFTSLLMHRFKTVETAISDSPSVLVQNGEFIKETLNRERVTPGEVFVEMRKAGLEKLGQIKWAILETDGKISIVPESSGEQNKGTSSKEKDLAA